MGKCVNSNILNTCDNLDRLRVSFRKVECEVVDCPMEEDMSLYSDT